MKHVLLLLALASPALSADFVDLKTALSAAKEAESRQDWSTALLHYENAYDSAVTDNSTRAGLRAKFAELRPKVAPNTDRSKAGMWVVKAYAFRTLDFKWKDKDGKEHHAVYRFRDDEIQAIRTAMDAFAERVWRHSWGNLRIDWSLKVIEEPLTQLDGTDSFWPGPSSCMPYLDDLKPGEADSIFVYAKIRGDESEKGEEIPLSLLAGTMGVLRETKGATYIGFNSGGGWCLEPSGEVQWHEWLHAAQWALEVHQAYPFGLMASPDDGRMEGEFGGDPCFRRKKDDPNWMSFYAHIMETHATRRMWRELSVTKPSDTPWVRQFCRTFLVLGPYSAAAMPSLGLNYPFIDETAVRPSAGDRVRNLTWQEASTDCPTLDLTRLLGDREECIAYAAAYVHSDEERTAQLRIGTDDGCRVWHNGNLILSAPVERSAKPDQNIVDVKLDKGPNLFLIKVANRFLGGWEVILRLTDAEGKPLHGIRYLTRP
ncbi:MAG: hypothetical protein ACUVTZ_00010 [Armatimonadota bacterium]